MFDEKEFPRFFVDTRAAESSLFTKTKQRIEKALADRQRAVEYLRKLDEVMFETFATLPAECEARISASEHGFITITVTGLTNFHDLTEVVGVLHKAFSYKYQGTPWVFDLPEERTKEWSFGSKIRLVGKLGPDADCKIVVTGTAPIYRQTAELEKAILCPGDPRYDDY